MKKINLLCILNLLVFEAAKIVNRGAYAVLQSVLHNVDRAMSTQSYNLCNSKPGCFTASNGAHYSLDFLSNQLLETKRNLG